MNKLVGLCALIGAFTLQQVLKLARSPLRVDFSDDKLIFCFPDINDTNFLVTRTGEVCVIDFQDAGFMPESFMSFVLYKAQSASFIGRISSMIDFESSPNIEAMSQASYTINMSAGSAGKK